MDTFERAMLRLLKWQDDEIAAARAWQSAQGHGGKELDAYTAGVRQGYGRAIATLRLHKALNLDKLA